MALLDPAGEIPEPYRLIAILWLSFLTATVATVVLFLGIDPNGLHQCLDLPEVDAFGFYTMAFLLFWLLTAITSIGTVYFIYPRRRPTSANGAGSRQNHHA